MRDFRGGRIDRPPRMVRGTHLAILLRMSQLFISLLNAREGLVAVASGDQREVSERRQI
jgi:hypothetical protein